MYDALRSRASASRQARLLAPFLVLLSLLLMACGAQKPVESSKPKVLVTLQPLAWILEELGGSSIQVEVLLPPSANPHSFEPGMAQALMVNRAALCVKVGHPDLAWESTWMSSVASTNKSLRMVNASTGIHLLDEDPHLWTSPQNVLLMGGTISAALQDLLPSEKPVLEKRLEEFKRKVSELHQNSAKDLAPFVDRSFLVFHPSWGYFARDHQLHQIAIEHEGKEPDAASLRAVIANAREQRVKVIFTEPRFPEASAEVIAHDIGARVQSIDALARDWPTMIRAMTTALTAAFSE